MGHRIIQPATRIGGELSVPGDKSISHRVAMLAAVADGTSSVTGFLESEDCLSTLKAMESMGAVVESVAAGFRITGTGGDLRDPGGPIDLGNSGTGMRLLCGLVAGRPFTTEITGDASIRRRPMRRVQEPLQRMGAQVELLGEGGCAPIRITGGTLNGIDYVLPVASAQVKSCVLLAGLYASGDSIVHEPLATRDHTERLMAAMGRAPAIDGLTVTLLPLDLSRGIGLTALEIKIPGDFSSACFWIAAAACAAEGEVTLCGVGLNPRRTAFVDILRRMGAPIEIEERDAQAGELVGELRVSAGALSATEVGGSEIPNVIDELPLVAIAGARATGRTVIRDAAELRHKESDRVQAVVEGLRRLGVEAEELDDGMIVEGPARIRGGVEIDSHGDHRVAMAMAVLALFADDEVCIQNVDCVKTSYPGFWDDMQRLTGSVAHAG